MVDKDELTWQHMTHKESQQAAIVEHMKNSQEEAEYRVKCMKFVEEIKRLEKTVGAEHFGPIVSTLIRDYKL